MEVSGESVDFRDISRFCRAHSKDGGGCDTWKMIGGAVTAELHNTNLHPKKTVNKPSDQARYVQLSLFYFSLKPMESLKTWRLISL